MYRLYRQRRRRLPGRHAAPRALVALCLLLGVQKEAFGLTVLSIRDFYHSVGAGYNFSNTHSSEGSASRQTMQDIAGDYNAGFAYSALSPLLLKGNGALGLEWLQDSATDATGSSKRSSLQLRYNVFGQILPLSNTPASFSTSSSRQTVSPSFTPSYQTETGTLTAHLGINNKFAPSSVSFSRQSLETGGLAVNTRQSSHNLGFVVSPDLQQLGRLMLSASLSKSDSTVIETGASGEGRTGSAQAGYLGAWHTAAGLARRLALNYRFQETAGVTSFDNQSLNGSLGWQFGKNLDGDLNWFSGEISSSSLSSRSRGGSARLQHKLLGSLTTGINLSANRDDYDGGENRSYNSALSLGYKKKLPKLSNVNVGYSYGKGLAEHSGTVSLIPVVEEPHTIPPDLLRHIALGQPTFDAGTVVVTGAQSLLTYPASYYRFTADGIELLNTFPADTEVLISYGYRQDPSISTVSTTQNFSASVDLLAGKYRLYLDASSSDVNLRSGKATALTLTGTRHYDAGGTAKLLRHSLNAEAGYDKSFASAVYYLKGSWTYSAPYANGNLSLSASDNWSQRSSSGGSGVWTNSLAVQSNYGRQFGRVLGNFTANYANVLIQGGTMSHSTSLGANLEARFGKLAAVLHSNLNLNMSDAGWTAGESVGISVRRSF